MKKVLTLIFVLSLSGLSYGAENCTPTNFKAVCKKDVVMDWTKKACELVKSKGRDALAEIKSWRYDCCGEPNYVWINTVADKPKMVMHPIKPQLDNTDLSVVKDPAGTFLFNEFVKAVRKTPAGEWVAYKWTKFGEADPTNKVSWVMNCKTPGGEDWVVGSGTWE